MDARSLACRVQFVLLPPQPIQLARLLHLIGAVRPVGWELKVAGDAGYDSVREILHPTHASVLTISVSTRPSPSFEASQPSQSIETSIEGGIDTHTAADDAGSVATDKRRRVESASGHAADGQSHPADVLLPLTNQTHDTGSFLGTDVAEGRWQNYHWCELSV